MGQSGLQWCSKHSLRPLLLASGCLEGWCPPLPCTKERGEGRRRKGKRKKSKEEDVGGGGGSTYELE